MGRVRLMLEWRWGWGRRDWEEMRGVGWEVGRDGPWNRARKGLATEWERMQALAME